MATLVCELTTALGRRAAQELRGRPADAPLGNADALAIATLLELGSVIPGFASQADAVPDRADLDSLAATAQLDREICAAARALRDAGAKPNAIQQERS